MIRKIASTLLSTPPVLAVLRRRALKARLTSIVCYHTLGPDIGGVNGWTLRRIADFRADLAYLAHHYDVITLDQALMPDPGIGKPRAVITFDDGDRGLAEFLPDIVQDTDLPVTLYVATRQIETGTPFWFDRVVNALQDQGEVAVDGLGHWHLPGRDDRAHWQVLRQILAALKAVDPARREALSDQVIACGARATSPGLGPMSRDALAALAALPEITIGAHSHGHELLDQISPALAQKSVAHSRALLRDWTGQEVRHFAFPNGNHTPALRDMVRDLGFSSATILEERLAPQKVDPFMLPRISVGRYDSPARVRLRLAGI